MNQLVVLSFRISKDRSSTTYRYLASSSNQVSASTLPTYRKFQQHNSRSPKIQRIMNSHLTTLINPYQRLSRQNNPTNDTQPPQPLLTQAPDLGKKSAPINNNETG